MTWVLKNFLVCVLERNGHVMKTLWNFWRGRQHLFLKTSFNLKKDRLALKCFCCTFCFEEKKPRHKTISYCKAYCVWYSFIRCCSHCTVCSAIWRLRDISWYFEWGFDYWYIYLIIFIEEKITPLWKTLLFYTFE